MSDTDLTDPKDPKAVRHARRVAWFKALSPLLMVVVTAVVSFYGVEGYQARLKERELAQQALIAQEKRHDEILKEYLQYQEDNALKQRALARFMSFTGSADLRRWALLEVVEIEEELDRRAQVQASIEAQEAERERLQAELAQLKVEATSRQGTLQELQQALAARRLAKVEQSLARNQLTLAETENRLHLDPGFAALRPLYRRRKGELGRAEVIRLALASGHRISAEAELPLDDSDAAALGERAPSPASRERLDWNGVDLQALDLREINLRRAMLKRADLDNTTLSRANLHGAVLMGATLHRTLLDGADLRDTRLTRAYLREADLSGARLNRSMLIDANLRDANLTDAQLGAADLRGADLRNARLTRANLAGARVEQAVLVGADLAGVQVGDDGTWLDRLPPEVSKAWQLCPGPEGGGLVVQPKAQRCGA